MDHHSLLQKPLVYTQVKRNYETLLNMDSVCFIRMFSIFRMKVNTYPHPPPDFRGHMVTAWVVLRESQCVSREKEGG